MSREISTEKAPAAIGPYVQGVDLGSMIMTSGQMAIIDGVRELSGAVVTARDLRAGAAMVLAGLVADGTTEVTDIAKIERGYESFIPKMRALGADITRVEN